MGIHEVSTKSNKLTWRWSHCDPEGSASRVRFFHCTAEELTPALTLIE
jgi:hypothetical protein